METDWIHDEILDGLSRLLCLGLDRAPASDLIAGTAVTWHQAITYRRNWDQALDVPRFRQAFTTLAQVRRVWPAPVDFLEAIPAREQTLLTKQVRVSAPNSPAVRKLMNQISGLFKTV